MRLTARIIPSYPTEKGAKSVRVYDLHLEGQPWDWDEWQRLKKLGNVKPEEKATAILTRPSSP